MAAARATLKESSKMLLSSSKVHDNIVIKGGSKGFSAAHMHDLQSSSMGVHTHQLTFLSKSSVHSFVTGNENNA